MKKKCYKRNCKRKAVRQDGDKNLMCEEHFKEFIKEITKHKITRYYEVPRINDKR
ncbi:MAG: hypothetical protein KGV59_06275 [Tenacibaculum sp.]|nr:hypothetical protein [Tenacibaculum sp.]